MEHWCNFWRIQFSPLKCECITFSGKSVHVRSRFEATLYGTPLPHVRSLRYLGVWFDEHLTWRKQVKEAVSRARSRLWELRRCVRCEWGLNPFLFLHMVIGAIVPTLFFGAPCWASVLHHQTIIAELDRVLAMLAKFAFSLERNTSTEASLAIAGILPA